jgi:hypothetical protein
MFTIGLKEKFKKKEEGQPEGTKDQTHTESG